MTPRIVCFALLLAGMGGGIAAFPMRTGPVAIRGGFHVLAADFHVHSAAHDGTLSPFGLLLLARHQRLDAFAITNHNKVLLARAGKWLAARMGGPIVLVGEEITAPGFHIIGVGLTRRVRWNQSAVAVIRDVHAQGGVAIAAHPTREFWPGFDDDALGMLDGVEVVNAGALAPDERDQMLSFHDRARNHREPVAVIGSSDHHWRNDIGAGRTFLFAREVSERGILDALREGRTVVYDSDSRPSGDPSLIELLDREPIVDGHGDYSYTATGVTDAMTRTLGWLGLLGLAVLRGRRATLVERQIRSRGAGRELRRRDR